MSELLKRLQQATDDWQDLSNPEEAGLHEEAIKQITRLRTLLERAAPAVGRAAARSATVEARKTYTALLAEIDEVLEK